MSGITIPKEYLSLDSIVSIHGTVQAVHQRPVEDEEVPGAEEICECRFSIENEDGRFSVRVIWAPGLCDRLVSSQVQVIGVLRSSFFKQCHQHHHWIEALLVVILASDASGQAGGSAILQSQRFAATKTATEKGYVKRTEDP